MTDYEAMGRALTLALRGTGKVSPNPRVGCVIVREGRIIAEGWHDHYGGLHAEVQAIQHARESLDGATLVVTLEPCSHWGKQPPCSDAILATKRLPDGKIDPKRGICRVVVGMRDPNPNAAGGIERLQQAGIEVVVGVRERECQWLNRFFAKHITTGMPYIIGKAAISLDGYIATARGESRWITGPEARRRGHALRAEVDAVLVGRMTVECDDPQLGPRLVRGQMPRRIVLDSALSLPLTKRILSDEFRHRTIVCTTPEQSTSAKADQLRQAGITVLPVPRTEEGTLSLQALFTVLGKEYAISSVLVEGGGKVLSSCLKEQMLDELHLFVAPIILGSGKSVFEAITVESLQLAPQWRFHAVGRAGEDLHVILLSSRSSQSQ